MPAASQARERLRRPAAGPLQAVLGSELRVKAKLLVNRQLLSYQNVTSAEQINEQFSVGGGIQVEGEALLTSV